MTVHIMLDLETWGTTPGSDIRSIGACVFDPVAGTWGGFEAAAGWRRDYTFYVACENPVEAYNEWGNPEHLGGGTVTIPQYKYLLTRDARTVAWWNDQNEEARAAFANPVDLGEALERFAAWYVTLCGYDTPHGCLWSHGAAFDAPILAAAYEAVGLPVPWHYRAPRDTRTAFDMAGIEDHSAHLDRFATGTHHHALDDAICQARAVCDAYARLREIRT